MRNRYFWTFFPVAALLALSLIHCSENVYISLYDNSVETGDITEGGEESEVFSAESGTTEESDAQTETTEESIAGTETTEESDAEAPFPDPKFLRDGDPKDNGEQGISVGNVPYNFNLKVENLPGYEKLALYDWYGYVIVLNSFTEWCEPCQEETPELEELFVERKKDGFVIMQAMFEDKNYDEASSLAIKRWIRNMDITFPVLLDPDFGKKIYQVYSIENEIPLSIVINRDMIIVGIVRGYNSEELHSYVNQAMAEN